MATNYPPDHDQPPTEPTEPEEPIYQHGTVPPQRAMDDTVWIAYGVTQPFAAPFHSCFLCGAVNQYGELHPRTGYFICADCVTLTDLSARYRRMSALLRSEDEAAATTAEQIARALTPQSAWTRMSLDQYRAAVRRALNDGLRAPLTMETLETLTFSHEHNQFFSYDRWRLLGGGLTDSMCELDILRCAYARYAYQMPQCTLCGQDLTRGERSLLVHIPTLTVVHAGRGASVSLQCLRDQDDARAGWARAYTALANRINRIVSNVRSVSPDSYWSVKAPLTLARLERDLRVYGGVAERLSQMANALLLRPDEDDSELRLEARAAEANHYSLNHAGELGSLSDDARALTPGVLPLTPAQTSLVGALTNRARLTGRVLFWYDPTEPSAPPARSAAPTATQFSDQPDHDAEQASLRALWNQAFPPAPTPTPTATPAPRVELSDQTVFARLRAWAEVRAALERIGLVDATADNLRFAV